MAAAEDKPITSPSSSTPAGRGTPEEQDRDDATAGRQLGAHAQARDHFDYNSQTGG